MKVTRTDFPGLLVIEPRIFRDERGSFYESWNAPRYRDAGIAEEFLQDNRSISAPGVVRGMHYQKGQGQLVWVVEGRILDACVDLRPGSPTYRQSFSIELDEDRPCQVYMPPGFAHGFCVLGQGRAAVNYKCTQTYQAAHELGVLWSDPALGIDWPVKNPVVSARDAAYPGLDAVCAVLEGK